MMWFLAQQFHLRWSPGVRMEKLRRVHRAAARLIGVGSESLTTYPTIGLCGMCCTNFHSHSASLTGPRPWCGGACLVGRPPTCASYCALSPHVQAVVHSGPLLTVIW